MPKVNLTIWTLNFPAPTCDMAQSIYYCSFIVYIFGHILTGLATNDLHTYSMDRQKWKKTIDAVAHGAPTTATVTG